VYCLIIKIDDGKLLAEGEEGKKMQYPSFTPRRPGINTGLCHFAGS